MLDNNLYLKYLFLTLIRIYTQKKIFSKKNLLKVTIYNKKCFKNIFIDYFGIKNIKNPKDNLNDNF